MAMAADNSLGSTGGGGGGNGVGGDDDPVMSIVYCPGGVLPKLVAYVGRTIEVRIQARFLTAKNKEVATRQVWGTDVYTDDSDAVAILLHSGQIVLRANPPGTGIAAVFRVLPPDCATYPSTTRYNFKSRCWASRYPRTSLRLVKCDRVENAAITSVYAIKPTVSRYKPGAATAASATATSAAVTVNGAAAMDDGPSAASSSSATSSSAVASSSSSSLLIAADKQKEVKLHKMTATERGGGGAASVDASQPTHPKQPTPKAKRKMPDATIVFNSAQDPALKYALGLMMDRGYVDPNDWTAARLKREAVYFERASATTATATAATAATAATDLLPVRYELAREPDTTPPRPFDTYRWSQVVSSPWANVDLPAGSAGKHKKRKGAGGAALAGSDGSAATATAAAAVPKPDAELKVLERGLDWDQLEWGPTSVRIRGREYPLDSLLWKPLYPPPPPPAIPVSPSAGPATAVVSGTAAASLPAASPTASPLSSPSETTPTAK